MKHMGLFEVKNRLSEVCRRVAETGEPCIITRRGKPWVRIEPLGEATGESVWSTVEEGQARYGALDDGLELPPRDPGENRASPL